MFVHRPLEEKDIPAVCDMPQSIDDLFYMFPKATFPLTPEQLKAAIEQRSDNTVIELDGEVVGFANFSRFDFRGRCSMGMRALPPQATSWPSP